VVSPPTLVAARGLVKTYQRGTEAVHALSDVTVALHPGELVALAGPSGSGKSTLLNVLCGWEHPEEGAVSYGGALASTDDPAALAWSQLALVPQALGLLDDLTIAENVAMPARFTHGPRAGRAEADALMSRLGIDHLARRHPRQTSLGEQQRCCVARALVLRPLVVLADEPTAHQDADWGEVIFAAMRELARTGSAFLIATHNPETWHHADRVLSMRDGELRAGAPETIS
jgi:putative ABC transport system ATP-binding protein